MLYILYTNYEGTKLIDRYQEGRYEMVRKILVIVEILSLLGILAFLLIIPANKMTMTGSTVSMFVFFISVAIDECVDWRGKK